MDSKSDKPNPKKTDNKASYTSWGIGNIFWGLLLILLGVLFLLKNLNIHEVYFTSLWQLWPLAVIAVGVSIMPIKGKLGTILVGIFMTAALTLFALTALGYINGPISTDVVTKNVAVDLQATQKLRLDVSGGAGTIKIKSADINKIEAKLESNLTKLRQSSTVENGVQKVSIGMKNSSRWWNGNYKNDLTVTIPESLSVELFIDAGAASIEGDLSNLQIEKLHVKSGASEVDLKLGDKVTVANIAIDVGVSSVKLRLPTGIATRVEIESGLSSNNFGDLKEVEKNIYESDGFSGASQKIFITGKIGVASFDVLYY